MGENVDNQIKELIKKLNYYTKLYDEGNPEISDQEWDDMYFQLQSLERNFEIYYKDSPTQNINYQVVNALNKVNHNHPMLSLDKTKDINAIKSFIGNKEYIAMAKMDGLTCSLTYENGKLIAAETRGNGLIGEDILHNALQIKNIPKRINAQSGTIIVDGEVICNLNDFKPFAAEYKNSRNFASGSIRLLDSEESRKRNLSFIAWDCVSGLNNINYLCDKLDILKDKWNFTIVPYFADNDIERIQTFIEDIKRSCEAYGYPIDGVVFKYDKIEEYLAAGRTDHHFKGGIAYKFYDEEYETELLDITYDIGRTGQLTPVAIYKPIDIEGSICERASLHNISILKQTLHGPGWVGQKIKIAKMNMIIPQIVWAEKDNEYTKRYIEYPAICPICGGQTSIHKDNESEVLYCDNPSCERKAIK